MSGKRITVGRILILMAISIQIIVTAFIILDFVSSVFGLRAAPTSWEFRELLEIAAPVGLLIGTTIGIAAVTRILGTVRKTQDDLRVASGEFQKIAEEKFAQWSLTKSEKDVALFILKGLSNQEISVTLNKSEGTVKAQCASVFRKSGVNSRAQLMSIFLDVLVEGPLLPNIAESRADMVEPA